MKCSSSWDQELNRDISYYPLFLNILLESYGSKARKINKSCKNWKAKNKTVIIHRIYSEIFKITSKLLELVHKFSKSPGHTIWKYQLHFHNHNKRTTKKFTIALKIIKYLWINLTQDGTRSLCRKLYKRWRVMREDLNKGMCHVSRLEDYLF